MSSNGYVEEILVARLTHDHLDNKKGEVKFSYGGFLRFWAGQNFTSPDYVALNGPTEADINCLPETSFRLYDDDGELYYSGWLKDDDEAMVQQFVLAWAMADSGCTAIKVKVGNEWKRVID